MKDAVISRLARAAILGVALSLLVAGCSTTTTAPVVERLPEKKAAKRIQPADWRPGAYTVKKGDTLYAIALDHGLDYKELAELNGIENPNVIRVGQVLKLKTADTVATAYPLKPPQAQETKPGDPPLKTEPKALKVAYAETGQGETRPVPRSEAQNKVEPQESKEAVRETASSADEEEVDFAWPVNGKLLSGFSEGAGKGIDIGGKAGQPVHAAAAGKVVYSGSGLRGYGKLIIIKHNKTYLSAYAHNSQILVKEGQSIAKGQKIAEMGNTDTDQVKLHFEIRRFGKPVDPAKYLPG
jgi:lipoprotein NlpD